MLAVRFTIFGEPASKANSRRVVPAQGARKVRVIKSQKALDYAELFEQQCPCHDRLLEGDLYMIAKIYYASRRPDLDESLILDLMQKRIYQNDRQVKRRYVEWGLDTANPRAEIMVGQLNALSAPAGHRGAQVLDGGDDESPPLGPLRLGEKATILDIIEGQGFASLFFPERGPDVRRSI